jgi:hypothetical protein
MSNDRELRVCSIIDDGILQIQIGYWRKRGTLFVVTGGHVMVDGRDLDRLITALEDARKAMGALGRTAPR